jgi:short-subunit dehydrogenase
MANKKLKNINEQVIVVTGASSGIGLATAELAARKGAQVVLSARSGQTLEKISRRLNGQGAKTIAVVADMSDRTQVQQLADTVVQKFGRIDTWVNNAGLSIYGRLDEVSEDDSRRLFDTNFWGIVHGSLVALPFLLKQGGALINVGSEVSEAVVPLQAMYSASKHAVKGFTDGLRIEIEEIDKAPVSITLIQPTAVNTPFPQHAKNYMDKEPKLPDPMIDPQQVAEAIIDAAQTPTHHVKVGFHAKLNTFVANNIPGFADHMAAKYVDKQQKNEPPRHRDGTLYQPGESGQTHGVPSKA